MKYEEIKLLVEKYGEDYILDGDIKNIFNIIKDSPAMQAQLEQKINAEWLEQLKQAGKIYVYTDYRKPSLMDDPSQVYPFIEFTKQDEYKRGKNGATTSVPVLRYVCKESRQYLSTNREDIAKETERRMKSKGLMPEEK
ncbi:MAG: hypothetical protein J6A36_04485 [Clostridia bacterium]|nr:hypothetical protein [Clostridia bacterium]